MIYRFGAGLYYANATRFTAEVLELVERRGPAAQVVLPGGLGDR